MMNRSLLLAICLAYISAPAAAVQISFQNLPQTDENSTLNGFLGATVDGIYVNIICNDYYSTTYVPGGPWEYNISTLPTLTHARFGSDDPARQRYTVAAILLGGLANAVDPHAISSYQYALWTLFSPSVASYGDSAALLDAAQNAVLDPAWVQNLRIYTPAESAASNQEFLGFSSTDETVVTTPEPGTIILIGMGFILLSILGKLYSQHESQERGIAGTGWNDPADKSDGDRFYRDGSGGPA